MKTILFTCFLLLTAIPMLYSTEVREIAVINIDSLNPDIQSTTIDIRLINRKSLGKYSCYDLKSVIDSHTKNLQPSERNNLIIIAESEAGDTLTFSYRETEPEVSKLTPFFIDSRIRIRMGDTLILRDKRSRKGDLDLGPLERKFRGVVQKRIFLQMDKIPKEVASELMKNGTIIFPQDFTPRRWLKKIKFFKLYLSK